jgi:uncharacterized protein (DUF885 family)
VVIEDLQDLSTAPDRRTVAEVSDAAVVDYTAASPMLATFVGVPGHDGALDDLSPDGLSHRRELVARFRRDLLAASSDGPADEVARRVALERVEVELDQHDSGWMHAALNVIDSPLQNVRMVFDIMGADTDDERATVAQRMRAVPGALAGYRSSLLHAAQHGQVSAVRQVRRCADQCRAFAGSTAEPGFFSAMTAGWDVPTALRADLRSAAAVAEAAYAEMAGFLDRELAPLAPTADAVGIERYRLQSRDFLGATVDLAETYQWGWHEFGEIDREMRAVSERIAPGRGPAGAAAQLDQDPRYQIDGTDALVAWMQQLSDRAIDELGRTHFLIDPPLRGLDCRIAPPGGSVGAYYTGPSDDFSRPGTMWWSVEDDHRTFSTWRETTTVYHEGVPGHHLQIATAVHRRDRLNDYQRLFAATSGHAEGWALYAERLVRELGYLEQDGDLLGLLDSQLFRAARVVLDIGMHLQLPIPAGTGFHEGETWTPELGLEFLLTRTLTEPAYARDEIDRYLGWAGQAPAYKVGERVWRDGRAAAEARHGSAFDLRHFHTEALALGGMGLDPLAELLAAI